jgi:putative transposase
MPPLKHFYGQNHLHYLTANTYRKARIFGSDRYKRKFVQTLDDLRTELGFRIAGYVLMPEHSHLLIWPGPCRTLP